MGYKPSHQVTWESSPIYHARKYRDHETIQNDETLEAFLDFLKYDTDASPEFVEQVKAYIEGFLEYKMDDVKAGEAEMLRLWTEEKPIKV